MTYRIKCHTFTALAPCIFVSVQWDPQYLIRTAMFLNTKTCRMIHRLYNQCLYETRYFIEIYYKTFHTLCCRTYERKLAMAFANKKSRVTETTQTNKEGEKYIQPPSPFYFSFNRYSLGFRSHARYLPSAVQRQSGSEERPLH